MNLRGEKEKVRFQVTMCDPLGSNSMKSANPLSGFHRIDVWPCLDTTRPDAQKAQGGGVICVIKSH